MKLIFLLNLLFCGFVSAKEVRISKAVYNPLYEDAGEGVQIVGPFSVDETPVTNSDFLSFIKMNPQFAKSKIPGIYADKGYLAGWPSDFEFLPAEAKFPVTNVSWFVARKYCESKGKRLPTIAEWEAISDSENPKVQKIILDWYSKPNSKLKNVGTNTGNKFGIKDMHGLVWELVDNFSEAMMPGDSRNGSNNEKMFCGGSSLKARDSTLYAAFIRYAFRSSLTAKYVSPHLGFRCLRGKSIE